MRVGGRRTLQGKGEAEGSAGTGTTCQEGVTEPVAASEAGSGEPEAEKRRRRRGSSFQRRRCLLRACGRRASEGAQGTGIQCGRSHSVCCALHTGPSDLQGNGRGPAASLDEGSAPEGPESAGQAGDTSFTLTVNPSPKRP